MARLIYKLAGIACFTTAVALASLPGTTSANSASPDDAAARSDATRCLGAEALNLAGPAAIDRIEVEVAPQSPANGAAEVRVRAGSSERVVHVWGATSRSLEFSPALSGNSLKIRVIPIAMPAPATDTPAALAEPTACVRRIKLMHRGALVKEVKEVRAVKDAREVTP